MYKNGTRGNDGGGRMWKGLSVVQGNVPGGLESPVGISENGVRRAEVRGRKSEIGMSPNTS